MKCWEQLVYVVDGHGAVKNVWIHDSNDAQMVDAGLFNGSIKHNEV